jgi:peptide/nickel transport system permease protein
MPPDLESPPPGEIDASTEISQMVRPARRRGAGVASVFLENKLALVGVILIVLIIGFCFLGPVFYHTNQVASNLSIANDAPGPGHPLGTDNVGYDELGRLMKGGQSSLEIGFAAAILAGLFGVLWGAVSGFFGGIIDTIMMRIVDALLSIPVLFVLLLMAALIHVNQLNLTLAVAFFAWLVPARLIRGETLTLRTREYVQAVKGMGGGASRSIFLHLIPNAIGTIVVNITFQVADAILALAYLGFLGFGLKFPQVDWGSMLGNGDTDLADHYWWLVYPVGIVLILVVMAVNLIGDALRDTFDVRLRRR